MQKVTEIVQAIKSVLPKRRPIHHHEPLYNDGDFKLRNITGYGYLDDFRDCLSNITGHHCVLTSSGTAALHIALIVAGVKPGDEVILPSSTFVGTANAVSHAGAIPHFIDGGLLLSPYKLRQYLARETERDGDGRSKNRASGRIIAAIIPVHLFGVPCSIVDIVNIATRFGIACVEDCAQALGTRVDGRHVGTFGEAGILSFNNNKIVTTNGGGAIITKHEWFAEKAEHLVSTGRVPHPYLVEHDCLAWNYRMGNVNAAIGLPQLEKLDEILAAKARLAGAYRAAPFPSGAVRFVSDHLRVCGDSNNWLISITVDAFLGLAPYGKLDFRDKIIKALHADGIYARASFTPLHKLPMYKDNPRNSYHMLESEDFFDTTICLPSGPNLA